MVAAGRGVEAARVLSAGKEETRFPPLFHIGTSSNSAARQQVNNNYEAYFNQYFKINLLKHNLLVVR